MKARDSSDAEIEALDALCERLAGFDERVSLEWLDGAMAVLIAGPRAVSLSEWLPRLLGDAWDRTFADPEDVQKAMQAVVGRWNVLASQLDAESLFDAPDELRLSPLFLDFGAGPGDAPQTEDRPEADATGRLPLPGELWALGVLETIELFAADWIEPAPGSDDAAWYDGCMRALHALMLDEVELAADLALRYPGKTLTRDDLIDEACFALQDLRCYWVDNAPRQAPRRVAPVPGRNDPCPCGSGRKYKKCHGAATAAH